MSDRQALVSIGLPTYKCEKRVRAILDVLLNQDYKNIEIIISDDASPDEGYKIIEEYAAKDKRITFFRQLTNIGYLKNFELVLRKAKGKYFFWAADDDMWDKYFISTLVNILEKNPGHGLAMPSMKLVYDDGEVKEEIILKDKYDITHKGFVTVFNKTLRKMPPVHFFYYGLWRTESLKNLVFWKDEKKDFGFYKTIAHDKILFWETTLSLHIYTIPDVLWYKTIYHEVYFERYSEDSKKMFLNKKGYVKLVKAGIKRLIFSPNISLQVKLLLPYFIFAIIWSEKKNLLKEIFPRSYFTLHKMFSHK